jgi:hypothetical protein
MKESFLIHFTNPVKGREDEYNNWYSNRHLHDIVSMDGFTAAQRFQFTPSGMATENPFRYLAIYRAAGDDVARAEAALLAARVEREDALKSGREPRVPISDALGAGSMTAWFTSITDRLTE